jgi:murein DD-endopeptidase MepM/ murein hydrolase activator NlpD
MKPLWAEAERLAAEEAIEPVQVIRGGKITTPFHAKRTNPETGRSYWIAGYHPGDDWNLVGQQDLGRPCRSAVSGRVVLAGRGGWGSAFGIQVIVEADDGTRTAHCHLKKVSVRAGETVKAGEEVGKVGATGNITGPHVHVEKRKRPYGYWDHIRPTYEKVQGG